MRLHPPKSYAPRPPVESYAPPPPVAYRPPPPVTYYVPRPPGAYVPPPPVAYAPRPPVAYAPPPPAYGKSTYGQIRAAAAGRPHGVARLQALGRGEGRCPRQRRFRRQAGAEGRQAKAAKVGVENLTKDDIDGLTSRS